MYGDINSLFLQKFLFPKAFLHDKLYCIYQSIVEKLHIELNSITILFHLCRLIRYCDYYFNGWQKVKFGWDEMSWY